MKVQMRYALPIFLTGTPLLQINLIKIPKNLSKTYTCTMQEELTGAFVTGVSRVECLFLIHKLLRHTGRFHQNGGSLNTKAFKNGGLERLSMDWIYCLKKFFGGKRRHFQMESVQKRNHGSKWFRIELKNKSLISKWNKPHSNGLTILPVRKKLTTLERSLLIHTENIGKILSQSTGCQNGTRTELKFKSTLIHQRELWKFTVMNDNVFRIFCKYQVSW